MTVDINKMLLDHVDERIYHMQTGPTYTFEWLLGDSILASTTELERMYLEHKLNTLIVCGETCSDLLVSGLNEEGRTLYCRVE